LVSGKVRPPALTDVAKSIVSLSRSPTGRFISLLDIEPPVFNNVSVHDICSCDIQPFIQSEKCLL